MCRRLGYASVSVIGSAADLKCRLQDLKKTMPDLAFGLQQLLDYPGDVEADLTTFFAVEEEVFGEMQTHELKPGGSNLPVTSGNKQEYVELYTQWVLQESVQSQFAAFNEGFRQAGSSLLGRTTHHESFVMLDWQTVGGKHLHSPAH